MAGFWPAPGWGPWDALVAAGFRCVSDRRNVAPPVVLFEVDSESYGGGIGNGCAVIEGEVLARCLGPPPDNADARKWAWTGPVPVLFDAGGEAGTVQDFEGLPCVEIRIPFSYEIGGA